MTSTAPHVTLTISESDILAIQIAHDELKSYIDTVGSEGELNLEEMPSGKLFWAERKLRQILDRSVEAASL